MLAAQEHLRYKHMSRYKENPLQDNWPTYQGHRQFNEETLIRWGFTDTTIRSDKIIQFQNWTTAFLIDEGSMDPKNPKAGIPDLDLRYVRDNAPRSITVPLHTTKQWDIYTDGSQDSGEYKAGTWLVLYCNGRDVYRKSYGLGDRLVFQSKCMV